MYAERMQCTCMLCCVTKQCGGHALNGLINPINVRNLCPVLSSFFKREHVKCLIAESGDEDLNVCCGGGNT